MTTSIVLAGGRSQRLGRNKIEEKLGKATLIERVIECIAPLSDQIVIATVPGQRLPSLNYNVEVVFDIYPGKGSLGGLFSGLKAARSLRSIVVAADMPFINQELLKYMIQISPGFDVVIPRIQGFIEPLHAIYSKECRDVIEKQIKMGNLVIREFLDQVKVRYLEETELNKFDPAHLSFFNVNTEADLDLAQKLIEYKNINPAEYT